MCVIYLYFLEKIAFIIYIEKLSKHLKYLINVTPCHVVWWCNFCLMLYNFKGCVSYKNQVQ